MASSNDVLMSNLRGFRKEQGAPEEILVEPPQLDDGLRKRYQDLRTEPERPKYRGFEIPIGMDSDQSERWFASIDARSEELEGAEFDRTLENLSQTGRGIVDRTEQMGEMIASIPPALADVGYSVFEAKQKAIMDPAGAVDEAKKFAERVLEGDEEAQEQALIATSMSMVPGLQDAADIELARRDVKKAIETREPSDIAVAGLSTVFAAVPLVGLGLVRSVKKPLPEEISEVTSDPVFKSELETVLMEKAPDKLGVNDVEKFLGGKGAKQSEIVDTKIPEFIRNAKAAGKKSVTKDELIQHLEDNKVQIEEVRLGDTPPELKRLQEGVDSAYEPVEDMVREFRQNLIDQGFVIENNLHHMVKDSPDRIFGAFETNANAVARQAKMASIKAKHSASPSAPAGGDLSPTAQEVLNLLQSGKSDLFRNPMGYNRKQRIADIDEALSVVDSIIDDAGASGVKLSGYDQRFYTSLREIDFRNTYVRMKRGAIAAQELKNTDAFMDFEAAKGNFDLKAKEIDVRSPKWEDYTLAGGENYQEILLTVPNKNQKILRDPDVQELEVFSEIMKRTSTASNKFIDRKNSYNRIKDKVYEKYGVSDDLEVDDWFKSLRPDDFTESHFSNIPNVMVHIRTKDRFDSKGRKILFVEEIQSDWHQRGRDNGYKGKSKIPDIVEREIQVLESARKAIDDWKKENPKPPNFERGLEVRQEANSKYDIFEFMDNFDEWKSSLSKEDLEAYESWRSWTIKAEVGPGKGPDGVEIPGELAQLRDQYERRLKDVAEAIVAETGGSTSAAGGELRASPGGRVIPIERIRDYAVEQVERNNVRLVPDAPLKDTKEWTALAIKRIFREAADQGYDGVAFTRGEDIAGIVGGVEKGQNYFYDKLIPSIAKKESFVPPDRLPDETTKDYQSRVKAARKAELPKTDAGLTVGRLSDEDEKRIRDLRVRLDDLQGDVQAEDFVLSPNDPDVVAVQKASDPLVDEIDEIYKNKIIYDEPYNFIELTDKVKDKVIKPQKLYSIALPGIAIGAAAAEEEELSAAAALGAIGLGGMALYRGARRTKVPEGSDLVKVAQSRVKPIEGIPERGDKVDVGLGDLTVEGAIDAMRKIKSGTELAEFIAKNADNPTYKTIAKRIMPHLEDTDVHVLTGKAEDFPEFVVDSSKKGELSIRLFNTLVAMPAHESHLRIVTRGLNVSNPDEAFNDVFIRGVVTQSGATAETALHELVHAATVRRISDGNLKVNAGTKLGKTTSQIFGLHNQVVDTAKQQMKSGDLDSNLQELLVRAMSDPTEFVAYGLTNKQFQEYLMTIKVGTKSAWTTFVEKVADLLGISKKDQNALSELLLQTEKLLDSPLDELPRRDFTESIARMESDAPKPPAAATKLPETPEEVEKAFNDLADAQRGAPETAMEDVYKVMPGAYASSLEHTGDIINRMSYRKGDTLIDLDSAIEKIISEHRNLNRTRSDGFTYDVRVRDQIASAAKVTGRDAGEIESELRAAGQKYADEHRKLTVYNEIQSLSKEASIALGEFRFDDARTHLAKLKGYVDEGEEAFHARALRIQPEYSADAPKTPAPAAATAGAKTADEAVEAARLWREMGTESPYFKRWFGGSKVVDEAGEPLVVYHGSRRSRGFEQFDPSKRGTALDTGFLGEGFYFSTKPDTAAYYAGVGRAPRDMDELVEASGLVPVGREGSILPAYLSLKNPYDFGTKTQAIRGLVMRGERLPDDIHDAVVARAGFEFDPDLAQADYSLSVAYPLEQSLSRAMTEVLTERGYDGVIARVGDELELVAFKPTQAKSKFNIGTFNPTDPSLLKGIGIGATIPAAAAVRSQRQEEEGNPNPDMTSEIDDIEVFSMFVNPKEIFASGRFSTLPVERIPSESPETGNPNEEVRHYMSVDLSEIEEFRSNYRNKKEAADSAMELLMMIESEYRETIDDEQSQKRRNALEEWYDEAQNKFSEAETELKKVERERGMRGDDFFYDTSFYPIDDLDETRDFKIIGYRGPNIIGDEAIRSMQEQEQRDRFEKTNESGTAFVDLIGKNGPMNRYILNKSKMFGHPIQSVQLNSSEKIRLKNDISNVQDLNEAGLISFLLFKELIGDVELL